MKTDAFLKVRVGLPQRGGALVAAARERGLPALVSANAFAKYGPDQRFKGFALPKPGAFAGIDIALDSAGFVAMSRYNGYPWNPFQYVELAASAEWAWWAAMDLCVEKELAADRLTRRLRIAGTAAGYGECRRLARDRGLRDPLPVLQGQTVDDYKYCADMMPIVDWPVLIGVGSMCRRNVHGDDGIERVVEGLDRVLPPHTKFHAFGVKGQALQRLASHPRIASTDSAAWDFNARMLRPTGRTQAFRAEEMASWHRRHVSLVESPLPLQCSLFGGDEPVESDPQDGLIDEWAHLVAGGEIDYQSALSHADRELVWARAENMIGTQGDRNVEDETE